MTKEQINKLHELENERHRLSVSRTNSIADSLPDYVNVNKMDWLEIQTFIGKYIPKIDDIELLRDITDKILHHFFNYRENVEKRLKEIEKEIEEL